MGRSFASLEGRMQCPGSSSGMSHRATFSSAISATSQPGCRTLYPLYLLICRTAAPSHSLYLLICRTPAPPHSLYLLICPAAALSHPVSCRTSSSVVQPLFRTLSFVAPPHLSYLLICRTAVPSHMFYLLICFGFLHLSYIVPPTPLVPATPPHPLTFRPAAAGCRMMRICIWQSEITFPHKKIETQLCISVKAVGAGQYRVAVSDSDSEGRDEAAVQVRLYNLGSGRYSSHAVHGSQVRPAWSLAVRGVLPSSSECIKLPGCQV